MSASTYSLLLLRPLRKVGAVDLTTAPLALILVSDVFSNLAQDSISQGIKMLALLMMGGRLFVDGRVLKSLLVSSLLVLLLLAINVYASFSLMAAVEDLMRYLLPVILMLYIASYADPPERMLAFLFFVALTNNVYQIYAYLAEAWALPVLHAPIYDATLFLRAAGWLGSVMGLAFFNFCCYVAACCYRTELRTRFFERFFLIAACASFSLKLMPAIALAVFVLAERPWVWFAAAAAAVLVAYWQFIEFILAVLELVQTKLDFYLLIGNSARFESYRVAAEVLSEGGILGKGIGTFGGPASVKHDSPIYDEYGFSWFDTPGMNTTDTFYPHVFVELGLIAGLVYLAYCFTPLFLAREAPRQVRNAIGVICFGLFVDSFFSFGLNAPVYLIAAYGVCFLLLQKSAAIDGHR